MSIIKKAAKGIIELAPEGIQRYFYKKSGEKDLVKWEKEGKPLPLSHIVKQLAIKDYQQKHQINILVETGSFMGKMT